MSLSTIILLKRDRNKPPTEPMKHNAITPYSTDGSKKEQVAQMFDNISHRYDFLNNLLSLGIQKGWRKKCVKLLAEKKPNTILDVATGTGDFAIECAALSPKKITGIDISEGMMKIGREKIAKKNLSSLITLESGSAETANYPDNFFDAVVIGYGVRNFEDLEKGLTNLLRLVKPGGQVVILEFSYPTNPIARSLYTLYFSYITPLIGRLFSKDKRAYSYLTESVKAFPNNERFVDILKRLNYRNASYRTVCFGVAAIYSAEK